MLNNACVQKYTLIYIDCDPHNKSHLNENFQPDVNEKQTRTYTHTLKQGNNQSDFKLTALETESHSST